jgi:valyl-tRNA synthetase
VGTQEFLVVATTRPETMLGDTAVAVHPEDERYQHLVGKKVMLPLMHREIPIIADTYVDREFGTGVVKITPAHDPNDFEVGKRHHLPEIDVMTDDGHMSEAAGKYAGLDRFVARARIIADLEELKLMENITEHTHAVGTCDRCKAIVEPRISTQWFMKMKPLAEPAAKAVLGGLIEVVPENQRTILLQWLENIRDWCISRQLWWGHRIPIWHCAEVQGNGSGARFSRGNRGWTRARRESAHEMPEVRRRETHAGQGRARHLVQLRLWPFSTLGWPDDTPDLRTYYPTSLLISGYDILFFWDARMIMMGLHLSGTRFDTSGREVHPAAPHQGTSPADASRQGSTPADASHQGTGQTDASHQGTSPAVALRQGTSQTDALRQGTSPAVALRQGTSQTDALRQGTSPAVALRQGTASAVPKSAPSSGASAPEDNLESAIPPDALRQGTSPAVALRQGTASAVPKSAPSSGASAPEGNLESAIPPDALRQGTSPAVALRQGTASAVPKSAPSSGASAPEGNLESTIPFRRLYLHSLVRTAEGAKMSKTKGTGVDPLELTQKFGTDALRYMLASMSAPGTDIALSEDRILGARAFANKIWNAARFLFMNLEKAEASAGITLEEVAAPDIRAQAPYALKADGDLVHRWIFSRLASVTAQVNEALQNFRFHEAAQASYQFFWGDFCDWYIEWVKPQLSDPDREIAVAAWRNIFAALEAALRLLHPVMPFLTEELWHKLPQREGARSIALERFPDARANWADTAADADMALLQDIVIAARNIRAEMKVDAKRKVPAELSIANPLAAKLVAQNIGPISQLATLSGLRVSNERMNSDGRAVRSTALFDIGIAYGEAVDKEAEAARLTKEIERLAKDIDSKKARLADESFLGKAPAKIVDDLRATLAARQIEHQKLLDRLAQLK